MQDVLSFILRSILARLPRHESQQVRVQRGHHFLLCDAGIPQERVHRTLPGSSWLEQGRRIQVQGLQRDLAHVQEVRRGR